MPFEALRVQGGPQPVVKHVRTFASVGRDADHRLVRSCSTGGVLLDLPCSFDSPEAVTGTCVRQPDGGFSSFIGASSAKLPNQILPGAEWCALADGRVAKLFASSSTSPELHVAVLGPSGDVTEFPPLESLSRKTPSSTPVASTRTMAGSRSRFNRKDRRGSCGNRWTGGPLRCARSPGASSVGLGGRHALAVIDGEGGSRVVISNDGGAHVFDEAAPERLKNGPRVTANEVGVFIEDTYFRDGWLRVGWEPLDAQ